MLPPGALAARTPNAARIVAVGDVMADVVVRLAAPVAPASDTPAAISLFPGGSAANTAVWLAAAGAEVTLVAAVGNDLLGDAATRALSGGGVTPHLSRVPGVSTGVVVAIVTRSGERSMLTDRGANRLLSPDHLPVALFAPGAHLHLSAYVIYDERTRPTAERALALAAAAEMTVSLDPCSASPLAAFGAAAFCAATRTATWCCANSDEAAVLTAQSDPAAAAAALSEVYPEVTVSAGADGVYVATTGRVRHVPAATTEVADTTGAGDAFTGTYLARRLAGEGPEDAAAAAVAVAARVVAAPGARPPGALAYSRL